MELMEKAFSKDPKLESIKGEIQSSGEGLWTVQEVWIKVPAHVIAASLFVAIVHSKTILFWQSNCCTSK